jgi:hypothetical protein
MSAVALRPYQAVEFQTPAGMARGIISYLMGDKAVVLVQPVVIEKPTKHRLITGLTTRGGHLQTVPLLALKVLDEGWQLFVGEERDKS